MGRGFIGLGNIGGLIARDLIDGSGPLLVYDVAAPLVEEFVRMGATPARSAAEVARGAELIGVCVRNDQDVHDVLEGPDGILSAAQPGTLVAIHSTVKVSTIRDVAAKAEARGVRVIDAPVSRGVTSPERKGIVFMLGGDPADAERARAFLEPAALTFVETGRLGAAMALKICNNVLGYLTMVSLNDAVALAESAGLDLALLAKVVSNNGVGSATMTSMLMRRAGTPLPASIKRPPLEAIINLAQKDLECALEVGAESALPLPAVRLAREQVREAYSQLLAD